MRRMIWKVLDILLDGVLFITVSWAPLRGICFLTGYVDGELPAPKPRKDGWIVQA